MKLQGILGAISLLKTLLGALDEDQKRAIDAAFDKLEEKHEPGSWESIGINLALGLVRGQLGIPEYDGDTETGKEGPN